MNLVRIGTRGSKLALWQANYVAGSLLQKGWNTKIVTIETTGDKKLDTTIAEIGSKGVFTEEIEEQLRQGNIDIAVHSAKDMPSTLPEDLELIAYSKREVPNDVLVGNNKVDLSKTVKVGTSSTRRVGLLKHYYPNIETVPVRGNLQTRIAKMEKGDCDALMLAYAGVVRMGYEGRVIHQFDIAQVTPPAGQGSVAVEVHTGLDDSIREVVREAVNHSETEICLLAERAFLRELEGGCSIPSFCIAHIKEGMLYLNGGVVSLNGSSLVREEQSGLPQKAEELGQALARKVLKAGGKSILDEIKNM